MSNRNNVAKLVQWKKLLFSVAPAVLLLLGMEIGLRIVSPPWMECLRTRACPPHDFNPVFFTQHRGNFVIETGEPLSIYHPRLFWWPRPHIRGTVCATPEVRTNSLGLRGNEIDESQARRNVLLLGDSVMWGSLVFEAERFSNKAQKLLSRRSGLEDVQLINAGIVGFSSFQVLQYLKRVGLTRFRPEIVVVCAGINDSWLFNRSDRESFRTNMSPPYRVKHFLMHSNVFLLLNRYVGELLEWRRTGRNPEGLSFLFRERWNPVRIHRDSPSETEENFREIGNSAEVQGARVVIILEHTRSEHPKNWDPEGFRAGRSKVERLATNRGWGIIKIEDLSSSPLSLVPHEYLLDFCHLHPKGHDIVATRLAEVLEKLLVGADLGEWKDLGVAQLARTPVRHGQDPELPVSMAGSPVARP